MAAKKHETQEQSIKARKNELFEDDAPAAPTGSGRPFADFLKETPAAPLAGGVKAALWAAGVLVVVLLAAALFRAANRSKAGPRPSARSAALPAAARALASVAPA